jgi:putative ATPase
MPLGSVPTELRDAHYKGAAALGHGVGYEYPHNDPRGWVDRSYLPEELRDRRYFVPSEHGMESGLVERLQELREGASDQEADDMETREP